MRRHVSPALIVGVILLTAATAAFARVQQAQDQQQQQQQKQQQQPQQQKGTIDLDQLENNPDQYVGQTVTVEGEVDRVLGPHLFTIDERDWADAEREMPVIVPEPFAAMVRTGAPVRVTGTVQKVPIAEVESARGFFGDARIRAEIETKPVLVATDVTATQSGVTLRARADQPVGTAGGTAAAQVTDANQVAQAKDTTLVGRRVDLSGVTVAGVTEHGFWIRAPSGERVFVMTPAKAVTKEGQMADVRGIVLELPEGLRVEVNAAKEPVYIYADRVTTR